MNSFLRPKKRFIKIRMKDGTEYRYGTDDTKSTVLLVPFVGADRGREFPPDYTGPVPEAELRIVRLKQAQGKPVDGDGLEIFDEDDQGEDDGDIGSQ